MYTSIVVPLDGSAFDNSALPVALTLASRSDAEVDLVHVSEPTLLSEGESAYEPHRSAEYVILSGIAPHHQLDSGDSGAETGR